MFRAILIAAVAAAALSTATVYAGGSCSTKSKYNGHVQYKQQQQHHVQQVYVKPVHIEPVKYCYYVICYKLPCWDYQKEVKFDNLHEAKHMAQLLYDNGYLLALKKFETVSYGKTGYDNYGSGKMQGEILFQGQGKTSQNQGNSQLLDGPVLLGGVQ